LFVFASVNENRYRFVPTESSDEIAAGRRDALEAVAALGDVERVGVGAGVAQPIRVITAAATAATERNRRVMVDSLSNSTEPGVHAEDGVPRARMKAAVHIPVAAAGDRREGP
jgi:hypothetical protein